MFHLFPGEISGDNLIIFVGGIRKVGEGLENLTHSHHQPGLPIEMEREREREREITLCVRRPVLARARCACVHWRGTEYSLDHL